MPDTESGAGPYGMKEERLVDKKYKNGLCRQYNISLFKQRPHCLNRTEI